MKTALAISELFGEVTPVTVKQALDSGLITVGEAKELTFSMVLPPVESKPTHEQTVFGVNNYYERLAGAEERCRQRALARIDARQKAMSVQVMPGMVLRGSKWVPILRESA